jgi:flavin reductase (DIM6/NTAB) family NADH-FMN oxidoreductase RutF
MFIATDQPHGLPRNPFAALVVPRPIGWISTLNADGVANLAPYSYFNVVAYKPAQIMFASTGPHRDGGLKDSISNIEATGEFVANMATWDLRQQVSDTSTPAPRGVDEFEAVGLGKLPSKLISPPRVAESPAHLECKLVDIVVLPLKRNPDDEINKMVIGEVVGIHIDDDVMTDGFVDLSKIRPLARLGYLDYTSVVDVFAMERPEWPLKEGG